MVTCKPLVVGVDGSEASARALRWALQEARQRSAAVHVFMVWRSHAVLSGPGPLITHPELAPHHVHEEHRQELARVVRECLGEASTPELRAELVEGPVVDVLVNKSAEAAMLVLGDRGRGRAVEAVLGGTALQCIHHARCPVLIVPTGMELDRQDTGESGRQGMSRDTVLD